MSTSTGIDKAALLLRSLSPEAAEQILAGLGPERAGPVRARMQALKAPAAADALAGLLSEIEAALRAGDGAPPPAAAGVEAYRRAAEEAGQAMRPPEQEEEDTDGPAASLAELPVEILTAVLDGEQTHTVALVLNSLPTDLAGQVLQRLPPEVRRLAPVWVSRQGASDPTLLARIAQVLLRKAASLGEGASGPSGPAARYEKIAGMIRALEKTDRNEALAALQEQEPETAARVRELLYTFEDLLRIQDRSMQKVLSEIDSKSLALALKGATEEISEKILKNLSQRARDALQEEMEFLGMAPLTQVRQAQKAVVDVVQRLDQAGDLQMDE